MQEKSGLLKELPNPYAQKEIQANIKNWLTSEPSTLNLKNTLANSQKSPKASVILLPYYNSETQEEVTFALPKLYSTKTFYSFRQSVINEMKGDLRRAAERRDEIHTTFLENLDILKSVSPQDFSKWLKQTQTFTFNDKRGNLVGTTLTNKAYWLDRLEQAEIARIRAKYYRLAAKNFQTKLVETRKLNIILKLALYDSFLRGWVPSLVDNSLNSPYRQWLQEKRNEVWYLIIASARSQGMDIRPMITESTVFQIQRNGKSFRLRPLFVANPLKTVAVKSKGNSLVYYETPWNNRKLTYLKPENFKQSVWKEAREKFSENPETGLAILANQYYAKAGNQWEERVALTRKALLVAPKYMANKLIQQLWDSWPDNGISDAERAQFEQISIKEVSWKANKVVNEVLDILACFSRVSFRLDQENVMDTKIKDDMRACENDMNGLLTSELLEFFISKNGLTVLNQKTIKFRELMIIDLSSSYLKRVIIKQNIQALIQTLAKATIIIANKAYRANPTKALLNSLFRLEWYSGRYKKAFDLALVEISNHSTTKKTERFVKLLRALETEILKALIYSQMNLAGRKASDWIVQPGDIEHIPVDVLTTRLVPN